jgi:hypothetical protein
LAASLPEAELLSLVEATRRLEPLARPVGEDFADALWELKADPRATLRTVWLHLGVRERSGESLAEFSRRFRAWLARQPELVRLPDRAGQRLVTVLVPVPGAGSRELVVFAAQVGASGLLLLETGEGVGEDSWRHLVRRALVRLGGRPLRVVPPAALAGHLLAQRVSGEVLGCQIAPPDLPAELVLLARLEVVRGGAWPAELAGDSALAEGILRRWEDEVNGSALPGLGRSSRELFERLDRGRLRPLRPAPTPE